jgi:hypothetical protein
MKIFASFAAQERWKTNPSIKVMSNGFTKPDSSSCKLLFYVIVVSGRWVALKNEMG